jgi:hypothetical protein
MPINQYNKTIIVVGDLYVARETTVYELYSIRVNTTSVTVTQYNLTTAGIEREFYFTQTSGVVLRVLATSTSIIWVSNLTTTVLKLTCLQCILNGSQTNNTVLPPPLGYDLNTSVNIDMDMAAAYNDSTLIIWVNIDYGISRISVNTSKVTLL